MCLAVHGCGYPGSPGHASVAFSSETIEPGTVATYTCDNGYELLGPPRRSCSQNGTWEPQGIPFCGKHPFPVCQRLAASERVAQFRCLFFFKVTSRGRPQAEMMTMMMERETAFHTHLLMPAFSADRSSLPMMPGRSFNRRTDHALIGPAVDPAKSRDNLFRNYLLGKCEKDGPAIQSRTCGKCGTIVLLGHPA